MTSAVIALILSFAVSTALTPLIRRWALQFGVVDEPGGRRVHLQTTPRLGGIAVMLGFFAPLLLFTLVRTNAMAEFLRQSELVVGLVLGSLVVGSIGAIDDVYGLGPWPKLAAQTVAGVIAYMAGYRVDAINIPLLGDIQMGLFAVPVTVFWFLAITNAINLIDGLDGLAVGITLSATITNFAIAHVNGSAVAVLLSAGLSGALLGFLRYNFNPAKIFLGDSGSMFLGFTLAATSLAGGMTKSSTAVALLAPIIALGIPILDTLLAMIRRTIARQSLFAADRAHIHHRLLDLGFTHRRVVLVLYLFSVLLAFSAVGIAFGRSWTFGIALVLVGGTLIGLVRIGFRVPPAALSQHSAAKWGDEFRAQVEHVLLKISEAQDEPDLAHALALFEQANPPVIEVVLLDAAPLLDDGDRRIFNLDFGQRVRSVEIRFRERMSAHEQEHVTAALASVLDAAQTMLARLAGATSETNKVSAARVRAAGIGT